MPVSSKKRFYSHLSTESLSSVAKRFNSYLIMYRSYFSTATGNVSSVAHSYLAGLMMKAPRKNMERMEEYVKNADHQSLQHFLADSPWDDTSLQPRIAKDVSDQIGGLDAVLCIDESGFAKKGTMSVGVKRQWIGRLGKVDNCQVGVFSSLVNNGLGAIIGKRLYLPEEWVNNPKRCRKAGVPEEKRVFKTKPEQALELIDDAVDAGVQFGCICGDGFYGNTPSFLRGIEDRGLTFLMDVHKDQQVYLKDPKPYLPRRGKAIGPKYKNRQTKETPEVVSSLLHKIEDREWTLCKIRASTKGLLSLHAWQKEVWLWDEKETQANKWWLIFTRDKKSGEVKYALSNMSATTEIEKMVQVHAQRFWIERCFQDAKTSVGMADYQARKWNSWHRHMCMVCMAMLFVLKEKVATKNAKSNDVPLSYNDIVEMLNFYLPREDTSEDALLKCIIKRHRKRWEAEESAYRAQKRLELI